MPKGKIKLSKEKRFLTRFALEIPVKYRVLNEQKEIESFSERQNKEKSGKTKDVSLGGLCLVTDHGMKKGNIIQLDLMIPCREGTLKNFAKVVWVNEFGAGLKFLAMPDDERVCLKCYLDRYFSHKVMFRYSCPLTHKNLD